MRFEVSSELKYTTMELCPFVINIHALNKPQHILH